jgi:hypothetical protein
MAGHQPLQYAFGAVYVAETQRAPFAIVELVEDEQRAIACAFVVPVLVAIS